MPPILLPARDVHWNDRQPNAMHRCPRQILRLIFAVQKSPPGDWPALNNRYCKTRGNFFHQQSLVVFAVTAIICACDTNAPRGVRQGRGRESDRDEKA